MDAGTILVLTIQLVALFSIAGALLLYLLCKVRGTRRMPIGPQGGSILITSADTALGLQLCTHLASRGCRVFAGMKDPVDSLPAKLLRGWMKLRENSDIRILGTIVPLRLDVTREDVLREATEAMGAHLNASERGLCICNFRISLKNFSFDFRQAFWLSSIRLVALYAGESKAKIQCIGKQCSKQMFWVHFVQLAHSLAFSDQHTDVSSISVLAILVMV